ncbi:MAG: 16S rRNA (cytosine(1402)-N(4))-methyltransferase [Gammaproteobacteria bacterium CG_4_10_14_0_8_um_filter_38_16]|nr:MAG: 16S rRNA (cytosine(1402)-N(4))-methyltransferase [Gammaproteobacteria bacterium CG_4_10_14_0_8_um_filter_38_16]PJA03962.1 MAG: 16S rRNA (cytosine(1402)-N(4))-methyltransferase [Gammaproteobacteria bacterium CG_4_10_14_0_2_um_filter_38_22]PJB10776.1 MAG: 16S rRNA (cytosine(1402)-N(4))-methyltransferase [Gammaproteobacteria bacterium CG_4_9_14_3_um_filter_38_9]
MKHQSVLLAEAVANLAIEKSGIYVDATFGRGGHSRAILERLGPQGRLIAIDLDPEAIAVATAEPFLSDPRFEIVHASFSSLEAEILKRGWLGQVDGVLLDLGVSSPQLDDPQRGFSFLRDGPLDMRMNSSAGLDAATWINTADVHDIANVLYQYGEERFSRRIAAAIVRTRESVRITTTTQLASIVEKANPKKEKHKHPATRAFQAIRIFINEELKALQECLPQIVNVMSVGGRMCVISFHSLEDRMVKQFIQRESSTDLYPPDFPITQEQLQQLQQARLRKIGKSIEASETEIKGNPRARSARLRVAEKM